MGESSGLILWESTPLARQGSEGIQGVFVPRNFRGTTRSCSGSLSREESEHVCHAHKNDTTACRRFVVLLTPLWRFCVVSSPVPVAFRHENDRFTARLHERISMLLCQLRCETGGNGEEIFVRTASELHERFAALFVRFSEPLLSHF